MPNLFQDPRATRLQALITERARLKVRIVLMRAQANATALWVENNGNSVVTLAMLHALVAYPAAPSEES